MSYCLLFLSVFCCSSSFGFVFKPNIFKLRACTSSNQLEASAHISNGGGLLLGISDISSSKYYSTKVPIHHSVELVKNNRLLYNIIESERNEVNIDEYLKIIEMAVDKFMEKNSVWDRKELVGGLEDIARKKGTFACLLGGKSTGKSLVLREFYSLKT
jgi:hypothetical protein